MNIVESNVLDEVDTYKSLASDFYDDATKKDSGVELLYHAFLLALDYIRLTDQSKQFKEDFVAKLDNSNGNNVALYYLLTEYIDNPSGEDKFTMNWCNS